MAIENSALSKVVDAIHNEYRECSESRIIEQCCKPIASDGDVQVQIIVTREPDSKVDVDDLAHPDDLCNSLANVGDEIDRLRSLTEWRSIEKAPNNEVVLLFDRFFWCTVIGYKEEHLLFRDMADERIDEPIAWMPLPPAPEVGND